MGEALVGKRVRVWWPEEERWYTAVVRDYSQATELHTLVYDEDGDQRNHDLNVPGAVLWEELSASLALYQSRENDATAHTPSTAAPFAEPSAGGTKPAPASAPRAARQASRELDDARAGSARRSNGCDGCA